MFELVRKDRQIAGPKYVLYMVAAQYNISFMVLLHTSYRIDW